MLEPVLAVRFFKTQGGNEPVRDWLLELPGADRKTVGQDMKTVQFGWPLGMPLVRKLATNLWEVESPAGHSDGAGLVHGGRWSDGVASRLHQEVSGNAKGRPRFG